MIHNSFWVLGPSSRLVKSRPVSAFPTTDEDGAQTSELQMQRAWAILVPGLSFMAATQVEVAIAIDISECDDFCEAEICER